MNRRSYSTLSIVILAVLTLSGCRTPGPVLSLAGKTAVSAGVLSGQLNRLGADSEAVAELRAANAAQLHAANTIQRANYDFDLALTRKSGGAKNLELITMIEAWEKQVEAIYASSSDAENARKKQILDGQLSLETKSKELIEISKALAAISKEESAKDRLKFFLGYSKALKKEVDEQLKESNSSAEHARELIDGLKSGLSQ